MIEAKIYKVQCEADGDEEIRTLEAKLSFNSEKEARDYLANENFSFSKNTCGGAYEDAYKIVEESSEWYEAFIKA